MSDRDFYRQDLGTAEAASENLEVARDRQTGAFTNLGQSWLLDTAIGQFGQREMARLQAGLEFMPQAVPGYNPYRDQNLDLDFMRQTNNLDQLMDAYSPDEAELIIRQTRINTGRRFELERGDAGLSRFMAGMLDPVNFVPVPMALGKGFVGAIKSTVVANAALVTGTEVVRHKLDPTSTMGETAIAIGAGTLMSSALAGGIGGLTARQMRLADEQYAALFNRVTGHRKTFQRPMWYVGKSTELETGVLQLNDGRSFTSRDAALRYAESRNGGADNLRVVEFDARGHNMIWNNRATLDDGGYWVPANIDADDWRILEVRDGQVQAAARDSESTVAGRAGFFARMREIKDKSVELNRVNAELERLEQYRRDARASEEGSDSELAAKHRQIRQDIEELVKQQEELRVALKLEEGESLTTEGDLFNFRDATLANIERRIEQLEKEKAVYVEKIETAKKEVAVIEEARDKLLQVHRNETSEALLKSARDRLRETNRLIGDLNSRRKVIDDRISVVSAGAEPASWSFIPTGTGIENALAKSGQFPFYRLVQTPLENLVPEVAPLVQRFAWRMANAPGLSAIAHAAGQTTGASAEAFGWGHLGGLEVAKREIDDLAIQWLTHGQQKQVSGLGLFTVQAKDNARRAIRKGLSKLGRPDAATGDERTYKLFRERVGQAIMTGTETDPFIKQAAEIVSDRIYAPMLKDLIETGELESIQNLNKFIAKAEAKEQVALNRVKELYELKDAGNTSDELADDIAFYEDMITEAMEEQETGKARLVEFKEASGEKASTHFHRMWRHDRIADNEAELREILRAHFIENPIVRRFNRQTGEIDQIDTTARPGALDARVDEAMASIFREAEVGESVSFHNPQRSEEYLRARLSELKQIPQPDAKERIQIFIVEKKLKKFDEKQEINDWLLPGALMSRRLDIPNHKVMDFIENDWEEVTAHYVQRVGPRIEIAKRFGDGRARTHRSIIIEELRARAWREKDKAKAKAIFDQIPKVEQDMEDLTMKVLGLYEVPKDPSSLSNRVIKTLMGFNVLGAMGKSSYMALSDSGNALMVHFGMTFMRQWANALMSTGRHVRSPINIAKHEAVLAGPATEVSNGMRFAQYSEMGNRYYGMTRYEKWVHARVQNFFNWNLLAPWTDMIKRFSGAMAQGLMISDSIKWRDGTLPKYRMQELARAGMDRERAIRFADQWERAGAQVHDGLHIANTLNWEDAALAKEFRAILAGEINNLVITSGAADRPNILSNDMAKLVLQYKGFSVMATQKLLLANLQRRDKRMMSGLLSMIAISWIVDLARRPDYIQLSFQEQMLRAVENSGVTGLILDINENLERASRNQLGIRATFGMDPRTKEDSWAKQVSPLTGAVGNQWLSAVWAATSPDAQTSDQVRAVRYLLPYNNLLYFSKMVDKAQRATIDMIEGVKEP